MRALSAGQAALAASVVTCGQGRPVGGTDSGSCGSCVPRHSHWRSQILTEWSRLAESTLLLSKGWKSCRGRAVLMTCKSNGCSHKVQGLFEKGEQCCWLSRSPGTDGAHRRRAYLAHSAAMQAIRCGPAESGTHNAEHFIAVAPLPAQDADADAGADVPQAQRAVLQAPACSQSRTGEGAISGSLPPQHCSWQGLTSKICCQVVFS